MRREEGPTYEEVVQQILSAAGGPVAVDKLVDGVLALKATASKNPHQLVRNKLREFEGGVLIYLDTDHVLAVPLAYKGARFRIRLNQEMINREAILADKFDHFLPRLLEVDNMMLMDRAGGPIPFKIKVTTREEKSPIFGAYMIETRWIVLKEWFRQQKMGPKDHLLVTIEDWERGTFRLEREPLEKQRSKQINETNQIVADMLYTMLENARYESIYLFKALPTLYAQLPDKAGCPPDHWHFILRQDERMKTDGFDIRYAESHTLWDSLNANMFNKEVSPKAKPEMKPVKRSQKEVYRFRAAFKHRTSTWRDIEILGDQTLFDLDKELRSSFNHDTSDHLSGFWKLIARGTGKQKRYREVDIGSINPFEEGEAAGFQVSSLGLQVGDMLKYVYDFGDWIEHTLTLRSISDPQPDIKYPREVARNKPKHKYCTRCKEHGNQTVATWICITCSEKQGQEVVLCEKCMGLAKHEEHYSVELVY